MTDHSQDAVILARMRSGASISPRDAYHLCGCLALHSAVARLRKAGFDVRCKMRSANGKRFGSYTIAAPQQLPLDMAA